MKTDPNKICSNQKENKGWAFVHDAIAHPLMALTGYHKVSLRFHNYTSHKAWPRTKNVQTKPKIRYWKHGLYECIGLGLHSFDKSPEEAYARWLKFIQRMRVD